MMVKLRAAAASTDRIQFVNSSLSRCLRARAVTILTRDEDRALAVRRWARCFGWAPIGRCAPDPDTCDGQRPPQRLSTSWWICERFVAAAETGLSSRARNVLNGVDHKVVGVDAPPRALTVTLARATR